MNKVRMHTDMTIDMTPDFLNTMIIGKPVRINCSLKTKAFADKCLGMNAVNLSYHWLTLDGAVEIWDGNRSKPLPLVSQDTVNVELVVDPPAKLGTYQLELDLVAEGVRWLNCCLERKIVAILPASIKWNEFSSLPPKFLAAIVSWANHLVHLDASDYQTFHDLDFENELPLWIGSYLERSLKIDRSSAILDMATGTGKYRLALLKTGFYNSWGADTSESMLDLQREFQSKIMPLQSDKLIHLTSLKIPVPDNFFDLLLLGSALHHLANLDEFLKEAWRVLKPAGKFLAIDEPCNKHWFQYLRWGENGLIVDMGEMYESWLYRYPVRTQSSVFFAEVWDAEGFNINELSSRLTFNGFSLRSVQYGQFFGYIFQHFMLPHIQNASAKARVKQLCEEIDRLIVENCSSEFVSRSFLTMMFFAESSKCYPP